MNELNQLIGNTPIIRLNYELNGEKKEYMLN